MICRNCGKELNPTAKFCKSCGSKIELQADSNPTISTSKLPDTNVTAPLCTKCGNELIPNAKFCKACGNKVELQADATSQTQTSELENATSGVLKCKSCGDALIPTAKFCNACGARNEMQTDQNTAPLGASNANVKPKPKSMALTKIFLILVIIVFLCASLYYTYKTFLPSLSTSGNIAPLSTQTTEPSSAATETSSAATEPSSADADTAKTECELLIENEKQARAICEANRLTCGDVAYAVAARQASKCNSDGTSPSDRAKASAIECADADTGFDATLKYAEQGNVEAQSNLGFSYDKGECVAKDLTKAFYWYSKAAEQGDALAQLNLGYMYENGEGVAKDSAKAFYWYSKAAEQGESNAQARLGMLYENGNGVAKDLNKARYWYDKAGWSPAVDAAAPQGAATESQQSESYATEDSSAMDEDSDYDIQRSEQARVQKEALLKQQAKDAEKAKKLAACVTNSGTLTTAAGSKIGLSQSEASQFCDCINSPNVIKSTPSDMIQTKCLDRLMQ